MAVKDGNKILQVTLTEYHQRKLKTICSKTGLNKSAVIQRFIEGHNLFEHELLKEKDPRE
jgi:hypothetical protein